MNQLTGILQDDLQQALGPEYRLERELGRGGMGVVFLATDLTLDRQVAVKAIHPDLSANRAIVSRFLDEARTIAKLRHPNIVAVHAAGQAAGLLFYVMDYWPGETLRQRLRREGPLPEGVAIAITAAIGSALDAAAAAGVVHRDLKPENILLDGPAEEPRALLADFGIARPVEGGASHTNPGGIMGTPAYMSPEQAAGEPLDGRSDLYSLGVVLYEMLAGEPPFTGPPRVVISKQIMDPPPSLSGHRLSVTPTTTAALLRALEKAPEDRWPTGKALARALAGHGSAPVTPRPQSPPGRRWGVMAGILGSVAVVLGMLMMRSDGPPRDTNPRQSILVLPFENLRDAAALDWLGDGAVNMLTLSLSQWRDLTVVDQNRVHDLLTAQHLPDRAPIGLDLARRMARQAGVWTVVLGDFSQLKDSLFLVARTYDVATGRRLDVVQSSGRAVEDVRPLFDDLAAKLLDLTGAPKGSRSTVTAATTESLEAYRAYLRGIEALNHWRLQDASRELERAVGLDTTFSLAHYKLALARGWVTGVSDSIGRDAIARASRTSERLPPRERQLVDAFRALMVGETEQSEQQYVELVARDSTDPDAWYGLADAAFHGGYDHDDVRRLTRSLRAFKRVLGLDSSYVLAYEHITALLNTASQRGSWIALLPADSLARIDSAGTRLVDSLTAEGARIRARHDALEAARNWTRVQPNTARAHYALYQALLAGDDATGALREAGQIRALLPLPTQPIASFLEARAQMRAGQYPEAAQTVRVALEKLDSVTTLTDFDLGRDLVGSVVAGANPVAYSGDLRSAARVLRLSRELHEAFWTMADSAHGKSMMRSPAAMELQQQAQLFAAAGGPTATLRSLWNHVANTARHAKPTLRATILAPGVAAAVGLAVGPSSDTLALKEWTNLSGQPLPPDLDALLAVGHGDSSSARRYLQSARRGADSTGSRIDSGFALGDRRPVIAQTYFQLGDYRGVIRTLDHFGPGDFFTGTFDPRWALLPRARLLVGMAHERLGELVLAAAAYQEVIDQWGTAVDPALTPFVQQARLGYARVRGVTEPTGGYL